MIAATTAANASLVSLLCKHAGKPQDTLCRCMPREQLRVPSQMPLGQGPAAAVKCCARKCAGGPPRFVSPWLPSTSNAAASQKRSTLPLMLYLPGALLTNHVYYAVAALPRAPSSASPARHV